MGDKGVPPGLQDDLSSVVRLVSRWRLDDRGWRDVKTALEALRAAVSRGDLDGTVEALARLEDLGPRRLAAIAVTEDEARPEDASTSPPDQVLDLVNRLVHPPSSP